MTARRRAPKPPPRCERCRTRITFLRVTSGKWLPFEVVAAVMVDGHYPERANPVWGRTAWGVDALIAELVSRGATVEEAREEVLAMPWHRVHRCGASTPAPTTEREGANR